MRQHVHIASRRRDERLAMVRKLTLWITGGAAAASLGLGTAFASSVPGHTAGTTSTPSSSTAQHSGAASTGQATQQHAGSQHSSQSSQLSQPQQQPSQSTAAPVVTSGGS